MRAAEYEELKRAYFSAAAESTRAYFRLNDGKAPEERQELQKQYQAAKDREAKIKADLDAIRAGLRG